MELTRIFIDTKVFMYAVGRPHSLQTEARNLFFQASDNSNWQLCTSVEVLQELFHAYLPVGRLETLDAALNLVNLSEIEIWPLEEADLRLARILLNQFPKLSARDLVHLACCRRRGVVQMKSFDKGLLAAFNQMINLE